MQTSSQLSFPRLAELSCFFHRQTKPTNPAVLTGQHAFSRLGGTATVMNRYLPICSSSGVWIVATYYGKKCVGYDEIMMHNGKLAEQILEK
eukprot:3456874-Pleurochrysis_carterae.AAC.1